MNTCRQIPSHALPINPAVTNPFSSRWPFSRLQKLAGSVRFVSVDLADNISLATPPVGPLPLADRPERTRLMPWRFL